MATDFSSPTRPPITKNVSLRIDGHDITVADGTTILDAAAQLGIEIPVLCHDDRYDPVGVCRMCVVDVGARVYAAACVRPCEEGMEVTTTGERLDRHRATLTELLLSDQPDPESRSQGDDHRRQRAAGARAPVRRQRDAERLPAGRGPRHR